MIVSGTVNVFKNVLFAKMLGPEFMGYYSFIVLLATYGIFCCSLGLYEGSMALFPGWYGQGKKADVQAVRNRAAGSIIILSAIFIVVLFFLRFFFKLSIEVSLITGLFAGVSAFFSFVLVDLRSRLLTHQFGVIMLIRSVLSLVLGAIALYIYGYIGILISEVFIGIAIILYVIGVRTENFKLAFKGYNELIPVIRVGAPLVLNDTINFTIYNIDKIFIFNIFGTAVLGQYAFAMLMMTGALLIRSTIYQHLSPLILYRVGQGVNPRELLGKLNKTILAVVSCLMLFWYPADLILNYVKEMFFLEYEQAFSLMPIIYIGAVVAIISHYEYFVVALKKTEYLLVLNIMVCATNVLLLWIGSIFNWSLYMFAWNFVLTRLLYFLFIVFLSFWAVEKLAKRELGVMSL